MLDASGESLALLFVRVVLVDDSEAEETAEVARVLRYEAGFQKVHKVVCALRSFSRSWKLLQTEPCTDCVLD